MSDPTLGDDPILGEAPAVEICGRRYTLRRLGVRDTFALARIIGAGAAAAGRALSNDDLQNPEVVVELVTAGMLTAEKQVLELLASVIGATAAELADPEQFPMGSELDIIAALVEHQDLRAFFTKLGKLIGRLPEARARATPTA